MPEELPRGWIKTTLGEIRHDESRGISQDRMHGETFELYSVPAFSERKPEVVPGDEIGSNKILVSPSDVLLCKINPRINRAWVVGESQGYRQVASTEWIVFSENDGISPDFLRYFFNQDEFRDYLAVNVSGVGGSLMRVRPSVIGTYPFPLPPTAEQERIVVKLNAAFSQLERAEIAARRAKERLKRYIAAVLNATVTGELTRKWRKDNPNIKAIDQSHDGEPPINLELPPTWSWLLSANVFTFITSGSRGWARYYSNEGVLFIRVGNMSHDSIELDLTSIQRVSPPTNAEGRRTRVIEGDILISITADVGMIALVKAGLEEAYINQHVALARPVGNMDTKYLAYFLSANKGGQEQLLNRQRGATKVGLGLDDIRNIWIACPPLAEQQEIVSEIERRLSAANKLAATLEQQLSRARNTRQSLLHDAFAGSLVPQDPRDEPASVLLERIRVAREAEAKKLKGKRMTKPSSKAKAARQPLLDVLREQKKPMTPEELFCEARFEPSQVDQFYRELASLRDMLREKKPTLSEARSWPYRAHVLLQLKES